MTHTLCLAILAVALAVTVAQSQSQSGLTVSAPLPERVGTVGHLANVNVNVKVNVNAESDSDSEPGPGPRSVLIDNTRPRLDKSGNILDGHDGTILHVDGLYWLLTLSYGDCMEPAGYGCDSTPDHCGFRLDHNISLYTSQDLSSGSWTFVGHALDMSQRPAGTVFRPDLVFNPNTKLYVLWWNWVAANGTYMGYAAATAPNVAGPYTLQVDIVPLTYNNGSGGWNAGDYHLFVDDDGTGYVIYSSNHWMAVEQLAPHFLSSAGPHTGLLSPYFVEAPALFKRNGLYYALYGYCCCFCYQGSGVMAFTALQPLGPWTPQDGGDDLACVIHKDKAASSSASGGELRVFDSVLKFGVSALPTPGQGCQYADPTTTSITRSQQSAVVHLFAAESHTASGPGNNDNDTFLWIGDRWQQSPDGLKSHDPQYWYSLQFDQSGRVLPLQWVDQLELQVP